MNKVYIIFDCSGSMSEFGRRAVIKNVFMAVRQRYRRIEMFKWNETVVPIEKAKDIVTQGSAVAGVLCDFLKTVNEDTGILLVSDGCWATQDVKDICSVTEKFNVYSCYIGQDANIATLAKVQTLGRKVFEMADFPMAIEHLLRK